MRKFNLQCNLPVSILKEGNRFIAYTPALDLSTSGTTYNQARERFQEAVTIFFEEVIARGTVGEVLENLGWQKIQAQWQPPVLVSQES